MEKEKPTNVKIQDLEIQNANKNKTEKWKLKNKKDLCNEKQNKN